VLRHRQLVQLAETFDGCVYRGLAGHWWFRTTLSAGLRRCRRLFRALLPWLLGLGHRPTLPSRDGATPDHGLR
jgi:hypothetical protein